MSKRLALVLAAAALCYSCSTTSGGTYSKGVESSKSAAARSAAASEGRHAGGSPSMHEDDDDSGGGCLFPFFGPSEPAPALPTGDLVLLGLDRGATLFIDGEYHLPRSTFSLEVGTHAISVRRFGYGDFETEATIYEGSTTTITVDSAPVPFAIESLDTTPRRFDPSDPGAYGSCRMELRATAPGRAKLEVLDSNGSILRNLGEHLIDSPLLSLRWDGRDSDGTSLAAGVYTLRATGLEEASGQAETKVELVSGTYARCSSLFSGVSGALFAPDARTLAAGAFESTAGVLAFVVALESEDAGRILAQGGFRIGIGAAGSPAGGFELALSGMLVLYPEYWSDPLPIDSGSICASLKRSLLSGPFSAAFYIKGCYDSFLAAGNYPTDWDGATRFEGISAGFPIEAAAGPARLFVTPELIASPFYPGYGDSPDVPGLFAWGYLRAGIESTMGPVSLAFSAAFRSEPFGTSFGIALPIAAGAEITWYSPISPIAISLIATGEVSSSTSYYFAGGFNVAFRY